MNLNIFFNHHWCEFFGQQRKHNGKHFSSSHIAWGFRFSCSYKQTWYLLAEKYGVLSILKAVACSFCFKDFPMSKACRLTSRLCPAILRVDQDGELHSKAVIIFRNFWFASENEFPFNSEQWFQKGKQARRHYSQKVLHLLAQ